MHYQVTGQRFIAGGYQLFTASGFGKNEHEAIADALASHPDRAAWQPHELRAEPDPINLAGLTRGTGAQVIAEISLHGHRARAGATPAASFILPTVACVLLLGALTASLSVCADGGQSLCATSQAGGDWSNQAAGSSDQPIKSRVAQPFSVAAWIDTQRPHRSEPWLSPDSLGAQSERAVSHGWSSSPAGTSPTENYLPTPAVGFTSVLSDRGLHSGEGVGTYILRQETDAATEQILIATGAPLWAVSASQNNFRNRSVWSSPAVGGNESTHLARERGYQMAGFKTALIARVYGRRSSVAFRGVEQSALSDQSGGMPGTGPAAHSSHARNLASVAVRGEGATTVSTERRGELIRTGVTAGETAHFSNLIPIAAWVIVTLLSVALLAMFAGAVWYRWPDEADEEEAKERVRRINEIIGGSL